MQSVSVSWLLARIYIVNSIISHSEQIDRVTCRWPVCVGVFRRGPAGHDGQTRRTEALAGDAEETQPDPSALAQSGRGRLHRRINPSQRRNLCTAVVTSLPWYWRGVLSLRGSTPLQYQGNVTVVYAYSTWDDTVPQRFPQTIIPSSHWPFKPHCRINTTRGTDFRHSSFKRKCHNTSGWDRSNISLDLKYYSSLFDEIGFESR